MQPSWKGFLKLSLVSVPVAAFSVNESTARPQMHQLHADCHSRIRYQKKCPIHGDVSKDEIVSAFEHAKGQYVVIEKEELTAIRGERDREISIDVVLSPGSIGPIHITERSYFLVPDGKVALKPYALLLECLRQDNLEAVGHGVLFGREELVLLRPAEDLMTLTALKYDAEVRTPDELNPPDAPPLKKEEVALTKTLLASFLQDNFDLSEFTDRYATDLANLIEAKVQGKEVVRPPASEPGPVINLMDALKKSLAAKGKPRRNASASRRTRRKSG
ncbi:MAG TPA: Ku protein [Pirellulaceae bacterium]|nr:Ku protein [Pirellulaceae bacterium]